MTLIQNELIKALVAMGERNRFTDAQLAKKLREIANIGGKNKAVIALADLTFAIESIAESGKIFSITVTSANDLVIERTETFKEITLENKQRRQRHEKSCSIFTSSDLNQSSDKNRNINLKKKKSTKRTVRENLDVNSEWE
ncbi:MAG: hypothetical protein SOX88_02020 [Treponema sp.]|nr:hypothetical protein [Treponema sp.]